MIVLQDPKEAQHAKNTVPLLSLGLASAQCVSTQNTDNIRSILSRLDRREWLLVFPCEASAPIESLSSVEKASIKGIILLDATWRKAKKMYLLEPLLQGFSAVHFLQAPEGEYAIRKSPNSSSLSTLEACAYSVEVMTGENMQPLRDFMIKAQEWQWRQQPKSHQHNNLGDDVESL